MRPINIVGAGLAGLTLAVALREAGVPVVLHEAGALPRHRVCGEFICGRGAEVLRKMGLGDTLAGSAEHRTTAWQIGQRTVLQRRLPQPAVGLSRFLLDQRLAERFVAAGGELVCRSRWRQPDTDEGTVLCSGRQRSSSDWIGLKGHYRGLTTRADLELHLGRGAYVGLSAVEGGAVNACALFRQNPSIKAKGENALVAHLRASGLDGVAQRLERAEVDPASQSGVAGVNFGEIPARNSAVLRLGDAFSVIPPFTGNGMSMALESAQLAAEPLRHYAAGTSDWRTSVDRINRDLHERFDRRLNVARRLHPWMHHRLGQHTLAAFARCHLLPFGLLYSLTH